MQLQLLDLPCEILLEIFRRLDFRAILRCCSVCQTLKGIVYSYTELQYCIELAKDDMLDGSSYLSYADRLKALLDRRESWSNLKLDAPEIVPMPGTCQAYELVGGVFAKSMNLDGPGRGCRHFMVSWLPSTLSRGHQLVRDDVGIPSRDFAIDPTQDLVAFLEVPTVVSGPDKRKLCVHLRTISTNQSHPEARSATLTFDLRYAVSSAFIQIADDVIGTFFWMGPADGPPHFLIWSWKDGRLIVNRDCDSLPPQTWDFAFLSNRSYMLACSEEQGSIEIYTFEKLSYTDAPSSTHVASLQLPYLQDDVMLHISAHTGPFSARSPLGSPFYTSPDSRILMFSVRYTVLGPEPDYDFCFFVHNRTLMSYIYSDRSAGVPKVPWDEWGPTNTRFLTNHSSFRWLRYVHGVRVICPPFYHEGKYCLQILDFSDRRIRADAHDAGKRHQQVQSLRPGGPGSTTKWMLVTGPTAILANNIFKENIVTNLPYRLIFRKLTFRYSGFMVDEERIIGLESDAFSDGEMGNIHVFKF